MEQQTETKSSEMSKSVFTTKVEKLMPGTSGHTLIVKVVSSKMVVLQNGTRMAECMVGDETGTIIFTARKNQVNLLKPNTTVILHNAKINLFKGSMRLVVDRMGRVDITDPAEFIVKEGNNLSLLEFEVVWCGDQ